MTMPSSLPVPRLSSLTRWQKLLGALVLAAVPGCSHGEIDGNGDRIDEQREAGTFSRLRSDADLDVEIVQASQATLTVSIDENLQEYVETRVSDGVLYIDTTESIGDVVSGPHVLIAVPELYAAKLAGSGELSVELDQPDEPLDLFLSGSGEISFRGQTAVVGAYLGGSGDIRLEGSTGDMEMKLSGSGSIHGRSLAAESGSIELSGSGDVTATVHS